MHLRFFPTICLGFIAFIPSLNAQLNPPDAPWFTFDIHGLSDYDQIVSTCTLDAFVGDTKQFHLLNHVYTQDAIASYTADSNLTVGLDAIKKVHQDGTKGLLTQHVYTTFIVGIADDSQTANASYYAIATIFANPQESPGQYVNLYGYYNDQLVKTSDGWRIKYHQYRFWGPGWTGNQTFLATFTHPYAVPAAYEPPGAPCLKNDTCIEPAKNANVTAYSHSTDV